MTYPVPGYPLYVDGAYYPAALWREFDGGTAVQDAGTAAAVSPAGGVFGDPATAMLVSPGGGMSVTVNAGYCSVPDSNGQGAYRFGLMQAATLTVAANSTGSTRLDYVTAVVSDVGSGSSASVEYLTGTTSPPAQPADSVLLAEISVPSGASSITSGDITGLRTFVAAPGCIVPVADAGAAPSGPDGQLYWDAADGQLLYSPVTTVTEELSGSGNWACPAFVTSVAARAAGGGGGGTGISSGAPGSASFTSSGNWTAPAGVSAVTVQAWGAGGSGGGSENFYYGVEAASGGGGGGYSSGTVPVTPGNSYTVTAGAGGAPASGTASGNTGGSSSFTGDADPVTGVAVTVTAGGGQRGFSSSAHSLAAPAGGSGDYPGGSGAAPGVTYAGTYDGGGGGAAAGPYGAGQSAVNSSGAAGTSGGGSGGSGGLTSGSGGAGNFPGGGGGGAGTPSSPGSSSSGAGAGGQVILSWTPDSAGGGGGGGGEMAYEPALAVTPGRSYAYSVGAGGGDSTSGGSTSFTGDTVTLLANGGQATSGVATGGAGGTGSQNTQHYDGGAGGTGSAGTGVPGWGGGGGASGSSTGTGNAGGNATTAAAGAGGAAGPYGGGGGAGGSGGSGANGAAPGGGGGGSSGESLGYSGGTGGAGALTLTYTAAPGAIPCLVASGPSWYSYQPASGTIPSVSVTITADGTSDYEITARAAGTGPSGGGTAHGSLQILADGTQVDSAAALASTGTPAGAYSAGWTYITSGAQGTTPARGTHVIEFTSSGVTLEGPAFLRVTQVPA